VALPVGTVPPTYHCSSVRRCYTQVFCTCSINWTYPLFRPTFCGPTYPLFLPAIPHLHPWAPSCVFILRFQSPVIGRLTLLIEDKVVKFTNMIRRCTINISKWKRARPITIRGLLVMYRSSSHTPRVVSIPCEHNAKASYCT